MAGLFYIVYQDEAIAFAMFVSLMNRINIVGFYQLEVPLIRQYMYQINRLIALYLPDLHTHFKEKGIGAVYFASSWFLTSFCYVLQYCKDTNVPPLLLGIFDKYLFVLLYIILRMDVMYYFKLHCL